MLREALNICRAIALLLVLALGAAACGGDGSDDDAPAAPPTTSGPTPMDESTTTTASPEPVDRSSDLVGTWNILTYVDLDGTEKDITVRGAAPALTFEADGTITYNTGCNGGNTTYATSGLYGTIDDTDPGQAITIDQGISEEAGCDFGLGEQNIALPAAWQLTERFQLDGDRLVLLAADTAVVTAVRR